MKKNTKISKNTQPYLRLKNMAKIAKKLTRVQIASPNLPLIYVNVIFQMISGFAL